MMVICIKNNIEESRYLITTIEERKSSEDYRLAFASSYTFMSSDLKLKQQVMNDIDINHIQYDLTWRQENVGGCWVNYDQNRFEEWFEGR